MRFKHHRYGETRIRTKFLWLPLKVDYETRWLERATFEERYSTYYRCWQFVRWIDD